MKAPTYTSVGDLRRRSTDRIRNDRRNGNKVKGKAADVSSYKAVEALFQAIHADLGPLDVLVNNAGVGVFGAVNDLSVEQWKTALETNLYGMFYCVKQALPGFETRGGGHIVQIGSLAGANAFAGGVAYNASKFGVTGFYGSHHAGLAVEERSRESCDARA